MKGIAAFISAIALFPMSAIASPDPSSMPFCYMVRFDGRVINLDHMCLSNQAQPQASTYQVSPKRLCLFLLDRANNATSQYMEDKARADFKICNENKEQFTKELNAN